MKFHGWKLANLILFRITMEMTRISGQTELIPPCIVRGRDSRLNICVWTTSLRSKLLWAYQVWLPASVHGEGNESGKRSQIDLLIDRRNGVINLCEEKFASVLYSITKGCEFALHKRNGGKLDTLPPFWTFYYFCTRPVLLLQYSCNQWIIKHFSVFLSIYPYGGILLPRGERVGKTDPRPYRLSS